MESMDCFMQLVLEVTSLLSMFMPCLGPPQLQMQNKTVKIVLFHFSWIMKSIFPSSSVKFPRNCPRSCDLRVLPLCVISPKGQSDQESRPAKWADLEVNGVRPQESRATGHLLFSISRQGFERKFIF